jgi:hypothetical protein
MRPFFGSILHALAAAQIAAAFPGLKNLMVELGTRQAPPEPNVPIGDLATEGATTPVGHLVMNCLDDNGCQSNAVRSIGLVGRSADIALPYITKSYSNSNCVDLYSTR